MREMFQGYLRDSNEEYKKMWENALIVVDTNVLINFYKYTSKDTYKLLFNILNELKEKSRLFIPHQVALEYFCNYEKNMTLQSEGYRKLADKLISLKSIVEKDFISIENEYPFLKVDNFKSIISDLDNIKKKVEQEYELVIKALPDIVEIEHNIINLLDSIVGIPYNQGEIDEIEKKGEKRFKNKVPPGWEDDKDPSKQGYRTYGSFTYQQKYGDYIMWNQIIDKAKTESRPVIFITEEKKEDWWEKEKKAIKKPQPHLVQEFFDLTNQKFNMFRTDKFVEQAKIHLNVTVTKEQLENFNSQIMNIRKVDDFKEYENQIDIDVSNIYDFLDENERDIFNKKMLSAFENGIDAATSVYRYNMAIEWVLTEVVNNLVVLLRKYDIQLAGNMRKRLRDLPTDIHHRVLVLYDLIFEIQSDIDFYESLGL